MIPFIRKLTIFEALQGRSHNNRLECYKLKLLPDTNKVSGWHIQQFVKEKGKSEEMIIN